MPTELTSCSRSATVVVIATTASNSRRFFLLSTFDFACIFLRTDMTVLYVFALTFCFFFKEFCSAFSTQLISTRQPNSAVVSATSTFYLLLLCFLFALTVIVAIVFSLLLFSSESRSWSWACILRITKVCWSKWRTQAHTHTHSPVYTYACTYVCMYLLSVSIFSFCFRSF